MQIELFSRMPGYHLEVPNGIIPIHIDDQISSLSAILLDDEYYAFMLQGRVQENGLMILRPEYLIPFKMYAWRDFARKKANSEQADGKDLRKHKLDVFRLLQILPGNIRISVSDGIRQHIDEFLRAMEQEEIALQQIKVHMSKEEAIAMLRKIYLL